MRGTQIFGLLLFTVAVVGCGSGGGGDGDDDGIDAPSGEIDAPVAPGYTRLIGRTWSLPPGASDTYRCVRVTIPEDTYITGIMAQAPSGTHHTVLSIAGGGGTAGPDGEQDCSVGTLGTVMLYASGVGTSPLDFPADVGVRIAGGTQIHLNLHLYNASDVDLTGESAILVKQQSTRPPILAEMVFAGRFGFSIPASNTTPPDANTVETVASGGCTANRNFSLFAVWPHMHKLAVHQKFEIIRGGTPTVLHDSAFSFEEQKYYLQNPIYEVQQGDQIRTTCTWVNKLPQTVTFGDSSDTEMCFTGMYRYPAQDSGLFQCTDVPGGIPF